MPPQNQATNAATAAYAANPNYMGMGGDPSMTRVYVDRKNNNNLLYWFIFLVVILLIVLLVLYLCKANAYKHKGEDGYRQKRSSGYRQYGRY